MQRAKNEVPGHGRANGNVRRLHVANFSHHDDIGILPQDMAQPLGEGEVDLRFYIDLGNAGQAIFHRLLDGDDAALHRIDARKKTIERRRLSAAGRPGQQDDAVRLIEQMPDDFFLAFAEIEPVKTELLFAAAEQTQTDRFPVHRGDGGDTHVDVRPACLQIHAPVLG